MSIDENVLLLLNRAHRNSLDEKRLFPAIDAQVCLQLLVEIEIVEGVAKIVLRGEHFDFVLDSLGDLELEAFDLFKFFAEVVVFVKLIIFVKSVANVPTVETVV